VTLDDSGIDKFSWDCMRGELPSMRSLMAFEAIARHRSMRLAAEELCVSASALSKQISQLEVEVGIALFEREGRHLVLTRPGEKYVNKVRLALAGLREATEALRPESDTNGIRLMVPTAFSNQMLLPRLNDFWNRYHIPVTLVNSRGTEIPDFSRNTADIAIALYEGEWDDPDVEAIPLFQKGYVVAACIPGLLPEARRFTEPEQFAARPWIALRELPNLWEYWLDAVGWGGLSPQQILWFDDGQTAITAAKAGMGILLTGGAANMPPPALQSGELVLAHDFHWLAKKNNTLFIPRVAARRKAVALFRDWLLESLKT